MSVRLSKAERETTILYTQDPEDETAQIVTADPRLIHRLQRLGIDPERTETDGGRIVSAEYAVPRSWVRISPPRKSSPGQRESARALMASLNAHRSERLAKPRRRRPAHKEG